MSIADERLKRCISVARIFNKSIEIRLDCEARFLIGIPYAWKKTHSDAGTMGSFCGRGFTLDEAARDFLNNCAGWIIVDDGINPRIEAAVVCQ